MRLEIVGGLHDGAYLDIPERLTFNGFVVGFGNSIYVVDRPFDGYPKLTYVKGGPPDDHRSDNEEHP